MKEVHQITSLDETWRPGDVVFDAQGDIWVRSDHPRWVWSHPSGSTRTSHGGQAVPDGSVEESAPSRPLLLLVRDGQAMAGRLIEGCPRAVKRARHNSYRVKKPDEPSSIRHDGPPTVQLHVLNPRAA